MIVSVISFKPQKVCTTIVIPSIDRFSSYSYPGGVTTNHLWIFEKSRITLLFFSDLYQNWTANVQYYALTALQILSKSTKAHASYYNFSKVCEMKKKKKIKKNTKKIRRTLKARISVMDGRIHLKFGI